MLKSVVYTHRIHSPLGQLHLYADDKSLLALTFRRHTKQSAGQFPQAVFRNNEQSPVIKKAVRQLSEYFAGKRKKFDLHLNPAGTSFQKKVWKVLQTIPYGSTLSYKEQAAAMGSAKAIRAVGSANGQNPIAIIVPCHRVIASNGRISGYSGGPGMKAKLLRLEGLTPLF